MRRLTVTLLTATGLLLTACIGDGERSQDIPTSSIEHVTDDGTPAYRIDDLSCTQEGHGEQAVFLTNGVVTNLSDEEVTYELLATLQYSKVASDDLRFINQSLDLVESISPGQSVAFEFPSLAMNELNPAEVTYCRVTPLVPNPLLLR